MTVTFITSGATQDQTATTSVSATFNIGTCDCVVFCLTTTATSAQTVTVPKWNGVNCPAISGAGGVFGSGSGTLDWFGMTAPTTGSHSFTATITSATWSLGFQSFSGTNQSGGAITFNNAVIKNGAGSDSTLTQAVTTANGDATVFGWVVGQQFSGTQTPTQDWQENVSGFPISEGQHKLSTTTSDSFTCTIGGADQINGAGFHIVAAPTAPSNPFDAPPAGWIENEF